MEDILKHYYHINKHAFDNLDIPKSLLQEWQSIINLLAHLGGASTGIIMKVEQEELSVLVASQPEENPYNVGDKAIYEDSGLYCAAVMMSQESLYIRNALETTGWAQSPNLEAHLLNYVGFPIQYPNGQPFGTICLMHTEANEYSTDFIALMEKMRDLIESQLKILYISFHDVLTSTYNRTFFNMKVADEMALAKHEHTPLSMLVLDIDKFKNINDTFGHGVGDQILQMFAEVVQQAVDENGIVVRYGGEEFIVLLRNTTAQQAVAIAENIRQKVANHTYIGEQHVTASIGVAEWLMDETVADWYNRADQALYTAKRQGRNTVRLYESE